MEMLIATEQGAKAYQRLTRCVDSVREAHHAPDINDPDGSTLIGFETDLVTLQSALDGLSADSAAGLAAFDAVLNDVHAFCSTVEEGLALLEGSQQ